MTGCPHWTIQSLPGHFVSHFLTLNWTMVSGHSECGEIPPIQNSQLCQLFDGFKIQVDGRSGMSGQSLAWNGE